MIPWTVACQAPLSMELSRQEYWSKLPFPTAGELLDPGIEPTSLSSPALAGEFFTTAPPGKPDNGILLSHKRKEILPFELKQAGSRTHASLLSKGRVYIKARKELYNLGHGHSLPWSPSSPPWGRWSRDPELFDFSMFPLLGSAVAGVVIGTLSTSHQILLATREGEHPLSQFTDEKQHFLGHAIWLYFPQWSCFLVGGGGK